MKPYNVEIFDREMQYVCNSLVDEIKFKSDYLDPEKYKIDLVNVSLDKGYLVHIQRDKEDYIGIISSFEEKKKGITAVTVTEIPFLFDEEVLIDVNDFNYSLEEYIKKWIEFLYVNGDEQMKLPLDISIHSRTEDWIIDYKIENEPEEDEEDPPIEVAFINVFDDLILPAFTSYQVKLDCSIDLKRKRIVIDICKNENEPIVIEADLPNIIEKNITIRHNRKQTNKVIVYDEENYNNSVTYYLHSDDSFDTGDYDRQLPVEYKLLKCKKKTEKGESGEEVIVQTFLEVAEEKAMDTFNKNKYTNLIELEMLLDDELIKPTEMKVGQVVKVISNGVIYDSILTAKEINKTITLIFGTVRLELTKFLKGRA